MTTDHEEDLTEDPSPVSPWNTPLGGEVRALRNELLGMTDKLLVPDHPANFSPLSRAHAWSFRASLRNLPQDHLEPSFEIIPEVPEVLRQWVPPIDLEDEA